jgi:hypothetical protein
LPSSLAVSLGFEISGPDDGDAGSVRYDGWHF